MKALDRKLRREVLQSRGLLGSIVAILTLGVMTLVGLMGTYRNLNEAVDDYYARCRMPDFWVELKKAPVERAEQMAMIEGVSELRTRISKPVSVDWPESDVLVRGLALSLPDHPEPVLSSALISEGSWFPGLSDEEVIVSKAFAMEHDLSLGETIPLVLDGTLHELNIVGTALSSEFIYLTPPGAMVPDPSSYGLFFLKRSFAEEAFDMRGACNSLVGSLLPEVSNSRPLLDELSERLKEYGVFAAYPRAEQSSNLALRSELGGLKIFAMFMPLLFFGAAALVLNVLMKRVVERQRVVIGTLKAMGSSDRELMMHFIKFGLVVGVVGGLLGIISGQWIAGGMTSMYRKFFEFPRLVNHLYPSFWMVAFCVALIFAALGTLQGSRAVLALSPAEAMRAARPSKGGKVLLERWSWLWGRFTSTDRMVLRNVLRHRGRTLVGALVSAIGVSLVLSGLGLSSAMTFLLDFQFEKVLRADYSLGLASERGMEAVDELSGLPGVTEVEPQLMMPGEFFAGVHRKRGAITGLVEEPRLNAPHDLDGNKVAVPDSGLLVARLMGAELGVQPGDLLRFRPAVGRREDVELPVAGFVDSLMGPVVYADLEWLRGVFGEPESVSSVHLNVQQDEQGKVAFLTRMRRSPGVQAINDVRAQRDQMYGVFLEQMFTMSGVLVFFAGVIFFGSVLNASLISLSERKREIATLRALGRYPEEVSLLFLRESLIVNILGVVPGLLLGHLIFLGMSVEFQNDLFSLPDRMAGWAYLWAAVLSPLFVVLAHLVVRHKIHALNWLEELGAKE